MPPSAAAKNPAVISKAAELPVVKIQDDLNPKLIQPKFISGDLERISVGGLNKVGRASDGHTGMGGAVRPTNGFAPNRSRGAPIVPATQCGSDEDARLLSTPAPVYTEEAQRLNVTGDVLIEVEMAADGKVHFRRLLRGLGHGLDEAAIAAVNQTRCQPAFKCGRPIDVIKTIRVKFRLT
jgi:protein TonB